MSVTFTAEIIVQQLLNGVVLGSSYALIASGLALMFGVMRVLNLAHGELYMLGAFFSLFVTQSFGEFSFFGSIVVSMVSVGLMGVLVSYLFGPLMQTATKFHSIFLASLGLSIFLQNSTLFAWGPSVRRIFAPFVDDILVLGDIRITIYRLLVVFITGLLFLILFVFLHKTRQGQAIRATSQNPDLTLILGVRVTRIFLLTFAISAGLAAAAGALMAPIYYVYPGMGFFPLLKALAVIILGGMGSVVGSIIAGYTLGLAEAITGGFFAFSYIDGISFALIIIILLTRPRGLFGTPG